MPEQQTSLEVVKIEPVNKGSLKAFASVRMGNVTVHEFRIVEVKGQDAVFMPQRSWKDANGQWQHRPMVELKGSLRARVTEAILMAWAQF